MNKILEIYYYECPKPLGFLEIVLDDKGRVQSSIFVDVKKKSQDLPDVIQAALDQYFYKKKDLPKNLASKEIVGTEFQKSIWKVISNVKLGKTITYTEMAEAAEKPRATRAAGTACGKNPLALFIPCHRVVRKQSEDYGYSWGAARKKWLLEFESKIILS